MQIAIVLAGIALLVLLISLKVHALPALLLSSLFTGLCSGMVFTKVMASITAGVGGTLGSVALVLALGAMYGSLIEATGVAQKIVQALSGSVKGKAIQWAVLATGLLVGIPLFYNAGFVILIPLVFTLAATLRIPVLYVGIPMATALSVTHGFLPPHPGPTALVGAFGASLGKTLFYGLAIGGPIAAVCGVWLTRLMVPYRKTERAGDAVTINNPLALPGTATSIFIALLPVILISAGTVATGLLHLSANGFFGFLAEPVSAFIISFFVLMAVLNVSATRAADISSNGIKSIAVILLIIAAGGGFKQIIIDSGTALKIVEASKQLHIAPLFFGWLVSALLRLAIGSATVASLTASALVLPLVKSGASPELMVLAVGAGSVFGSHVNDTGFWMFKEYFGLTLKQTLRTWTVVESCISVLGLAGVLLLDKLIS